MKLCQKTNATLLAVVLVVGGGLLVVVVVLVVVLVGVVANVVMNVVVEKTGTCMYVWMDACPCVSLANKRTE